MQKTAKRAIAIFLVACMMFAFMLVGTVQVSAASSTGVGMAAHSLNAYYSGWSYVWGGSSPGGVDCSGLIYTYNGVGGNRFDMMSSSPETGYVSQGVPNIHGLGLYSPGHVGVYVGNYMAVDSRNSYYDMCYSSLSDYGWDRWFKIAGVSYPTNGWVMFNGDAYYYQDGEYLTNASRTLDGVKYTFAKDGSSDKMPPEDEFKATAYSTASENTSNSTKEDTSNSVLKKGSEGSQVLKLQERLAELNYYNGEISGYFDAKTRTAVQMFQKAEGLEDDGIAGTETLNAIYEDDATKNVEKEPATEAPTEAPTEKVTEAPKDILELGGQGDSVADLQRRLKELGFYNGDISSKFDEVTEDALKDYFEASELQPKGTITDEELAVLMSEAAVTRKQYETLKLNASGYTIERLQTALFTLKYLAESDLTGELDPKTVEAVKVAQTNFALEVTGIVDSEFTNALEKQVFQELGQHSFAKSAQNTLIKTSVETALVSGTSPHIFEPIPYVSDHTIDSNAFFIIILAIIAIMSLCAVIVNIESKKEQEARAELIRRYMARYDTQKAMPNRTLKKVKEETEDETTSDETQED